MKRPRSRLALRLPDEHLALIREAAEELDMTMSAWVRHVLIRAAKKQARRRSLERRLEGEDPS